MNDARTADAIDGSEVVTPDFADDGANSYEQMVALTTWVNTAVGMLNRGEPEVAVLAKLSHDGCPDPQTVLDRALHQPFEEPEMEQPTPEPQMPAPAPPDPAEQRAAALDNQRGSSVQIGDVFGRMMGAYAEFGRVIARIATDEGQVEVDVSPDEVEVVEETKRDPLAEIQSFIDGFPQPDPAHKASMLAYQENLRRAHEYAQKALVTATGSVAQRLSGVDDALATGRRDVGEHISLMADPHEQTYLASQNAFGLRAVVSQGETGESLDFDAYNVVAPNWQTAIHEESEILVAEAAPSHLASDQFLDFASQRVAHAPADIRAAYLSNVVRHRDDRLAKLAKH